MKNLYIKDHGGNYVPVRLELIAPADLANKLVLITVGSDNYQITSDILDYVREIISSSDVIKDAMRRSIAADLLILPHNIRFEILSRKEIDMKTVCIQLDKADNIDNLPELKTQITNSLGKDPIIVPSPISLKEYEETKAIIERTKIRKNRHGGALIK